MLSTVAAFVLYIAAIFWTIVLLTRTRDWRFLALIALLALLLLRHLVTPLKDAGAWTSPLAESAANVFGVALAVVALLCVIFIEVIFTQHKQLEEQLHYSAFHDSLTGLPNRSLLLDRLRLAIDRLVRREQDLFALLFLDIDGFKSVNDTYGHHVGDELLIAIANRLEGCLRASDTVARIGIDHTLARLGGDEFTILLCGLRDDSDAVRVADRLLRELQKPFALNSTEVQIGASIGVAYGSSRYNDAELILRNADAAMYRAKALGKNRIEVFDKVVHAEAIHRLHLESQLRQSLEAGDFQVRYQPIVHLQTLAVWGVEALIRWQHPDRGLVSPETFLPIAEDAGLMAPIDGWVIRKVCTDVAGLQNPQTRPIFFSVNLSSFQLSKELVNTLEQALAETGFRPELLCIEISEPAIARHPDTTKVMVKEFHTRGIRVVIDDCGSAASSVVEMSRLPLSGIKIAQSIVQNMHSANGRGVCQALVAMAKALDLPVTAKGIETRDQYEELKNLGCDLGQGCFFSKPVELQEVPKLFADPSWLERSGIRR